MAPPYHILPHRRVQYYSNLYCHFHQPLLLDLLETDIPTVSLAFHCILIMSILEFSLQW